MRWTCKSTRELAQALTAQGHPVSDDTVGRLLKQQGYRLQRTIKTLEGARHPDRDAQFRYLNEQAKVHLADGQPVVSVDTKKKELVGRFANGGREWQLSGEPERVNLHELPAGSPTREQTGYWFVRMPTGPTATGSGRGRPSWPGLLRRRGFSHRLPSAAGPPRGTGSSIGCSARSR